VVSIQRGDSLTAAITAREDGRLRVAVFRPLCAKGAHYLIELSVVPDPEHGVRMRENNWEYALDCSAGNGNYYAADRPCRFAPLPFAPTGAPSYALDDAIQDRGQRPERLVLRVDRLARRLGRFTIGLPSPRRPMWLSSVSDCGP
jgi:hypothetical protein